MSNRIFKLSMMAGAVGAAFALSAPVHAVTGIKFSADGVIPAVSAGKFNWQAEQFMLQGVNSTVTAQSFADNCELGGPADICSQDFTATGWFYGQGLLDTIKDSSGNDSGLASSVTTRISYQFKVPVSVTYNLTYFNSTNKFAGDAISGTVNNVALADAVRFDANNYFRIFYNSVPSEVDQTAGTGYGTSEETNASQTMIFEGKVSLNPGTGGNNLSTSVGLVPIGTNGTLTSGGKPIITATGGGSVEMFVEHCDSGDFNNVPPGTGNPEAACVNGTTFINTNFFRSDVDALAFDVNMIPGYQAFFGTTVPEKIVTSQLPNFGDQGTSAVNNTSCDDSLLAVTAGTKPGGGAFAGCDMIFRGTNSNAQFNGNFAPEPGSLALLGLGLSALGFSARRRSRKATAS